MDSLVDTQQQYTVQMFAPLLTSSPASFFTTCWADNTFVAAMADAILCKLRNIREGGDWN